MRKSAAQRFMDKVTPEPNSGCWLWTARVNHKGYGNFVSRPFWLAHRYSYATYRGPIPDGLKVLHKCDIPSCVNPDHLFLGTDLDNARDRDAKGRLGPRHGSFNGRAKLSDQKVLAIRSDSRKNVDIAREYDVSPAMIGYIKRGKHWSHVNAV
jgi:hypothetical protein